MKYLFKTTSREIFCDKVTIGRFDYYVNQEKTLAENGDCFLSHPTYSTVHQWNMQGMHAGKQVWINKIIATNDPTLDIPQVVDSTEVLMLKEIDVDEINETLDNIYLNGLICGYDKAKETFKWNDEDMLAFGEWCENLQSENKHIRRKNPQITRSELFNIWKSTQIITLTIKK